VLETGRWEGRMQRAWAFAMKPFFFPPNRVRLDPAVHNLSLFSLFLILKHAWRWCFCNFITEVGMDYAYLLCEVTPVIVPTPGSFSAPFSSSFHVLCSRVWRQHCGEPCPLRRHPPSSQPSGLLSTRANSLVISCFSPHKFTRTRNSVST
jgi:hypothetical protein